MAFPETIVLGAVDFSTTISKPNSTTRSNPLAEFEAPETLVISTEINRAGRVSTALLYDFGYPLECNTLCGTAASVETTRAMFKISYNPNHGVTELKTVLKKQIDELVAFLSIEGNVDKILNQEH